MQLEILTMEMETQDGEAEQLRLRLQQSDQSVRDVTELLRRERERSDGLAQVYIYIRHSQRPPPPHPGPHTILRPTRCHRCCTLTWQEIAQPPPRAGGAFAGRA